MFTLLLKCFVLCAFVNVIDGQICKKRTVVIKWVPETYQYSYTEKYTKKNWNGRTVYKTRIQYAVDTKSVQKHEIEYVPTCCDGYIRTDNGSLTDIECTPICMPACENGHCTSPGECECSKGYSVVPGSPHKCVPVCGSCVHGTCVAPDLCRCDYGYSAHNGTTCQPICTEPCVNSTCIAPDTCECLYGFRKTDGNICTPYCSRGCSHGTCTEPETCTCDEGWHKSATDECVPKCEKLCGNGSCTAPNHCECNEGYKVDEGHNPICVAQCDIACGNGSCVAPNTCNCETGYKIDKSKVPICIPHCDFECGKGSCTAPNYCECYAGYKVNDGNNPVCQAQCGIACGNGSCITPNSCECNAGYRIDEKTDPMCVPHCDIQCGNGTCVAPNTCECKSGYNVDESKVLGCVPHCENGCGNGTCIAPNECNCFKGYILDKEKAIWCIPDCSNCEGNCLQPRKCERNEPFKTTNSADEKECENDTDNNTHICKIDATVKTTDDKIPYGYDDIETNDTVKLKSTMTAVRTENSDESEYYDYDDVRVVNGSLDEDIDVENQIQGSEHWMQSKWGYAVISITVIIVAIILGSLVIFRRPITKWCTGGSYVVEGDRDKDYDSPENKQKVEMRLSTILKQRETDAGLSDL